MKRFHPGDKLSSTVRVIPVFLANDNQKFACYLCQLNLLLLLSNMRPKPSFFLFLRKYGINEDHRINVTNSFKGKK